MAVKNIFASLIGINAYPTNSLQGCVKDALAMDAFLRKFSSQQMDDEINYVPKYFLACDVKDQSLLSRHSILYSNFDDQEILSPSFENISTKAFDHLKQAQDGDICIFFYSGHGSTIKAPEQFQGHKSKLQNETLVCVDSRSGKRDLIDKEIAFLLWDTLKGKPVHCLVIMDCCFAGNNTRTMELESDIRSRYISPPTNVQIPLSDYLGYDEGFYEQQEDGSVEFKIADYIQLAASLDTQTAQETSLDGGLFTSQLLDALEKGGSGRSYRELMQTTRVSVRNRNANQIPVEFATKDTDLDLKFLGGGFQAYRPSFEVRFDESKQKWKLFGGAIHGIQSVPENAARVKMEGTDIEADIEKVFSDYSYLALEPGALDRGSNHTYRAVITKYSTASLQVCLSNGVLANAERLQDLRATFGDGKSFPFVALDFDTTNKAAPFQIRLSDAGEFVLVRTGTTVPVFKRESDTKSFLTNVDYVGKWLVACELKNTKSSFSKEDFIFRLEKIEGKDFDEESLDSTSSKIVNPNGFLPEEVEFSYIDNHQPAFRLSIEINPRSNLQSCYVGALYLESKYKIITDLIRPDVAHLVKGGQPVELKWIYRNRAYKTLPLSIDSEYVAYNINEICSYLKIVVSDAPLSIDYYKQDELTLDDEPNENTRNLGLDKINDDAPEQSDWNVFSMRLRIIGKNKSHVFQGGESYNFASFEMEAPASFQARVFAVTGDDISKKLIQNRSLKSGQNLRAIAPASIQLGTSNMLDMPFPAGISGAANNVVQVLEISQVSSTTPIELAEGECLKIKPRNLEPGEVIIPFGYDEENDLYHPVGFTDRAGNIQIDKLPASSAGTIEEVVHERGIASSIKLFFRKVVWSRVTGVQDYNRLTLYLKGADGEITKTDYSGSIQQAIAQGQVLLLIHGIFGETTEMVKAVFEHPTRYGSYAGVLSFDYENLNSGIKETAGKLKEMLVGCGITNDQRLTIVSHSMGGLVARYMIEELGGDRMVKKLIQCGTPNSGSELSDFRQKVTGWLIAGLNGISWFQPYLAVGAFLGRRLEKGLFKTLDEMDPESDFLKYLNNPGKNGNATKYYLIAGDTSKITHIYPEEYSLLRNIYNAISTKGLYLGLDWAVFDSEPNDMAVKVDRMRALPWGGHNAEHILDCDHISYFKDDRCWVEIKKFTEMP